MKTIKEIIYVVLFVGLVWGAASCDYYMFKKVHPEAGVSEWMWDNLRK